MSDDPTLAPASDPDATLAPTSAAPVATDARAPAGYVIEHELGRGGMGVVYLARSVALQRPCALKMILSGAHSGDAEIERFQNEAQAIARLQHPGIVQVFEVGAHDGRPFMALEFCGGGSLDARLAKNLLVARDAAHLVQALAEAAHAAHLAHVIHRDLKPANVLLTDKGVPKLTDFGLAKKLDEDGATRTGSVLGTPAYMPPEQAEGRKDIGPAADVYALGAILYECLTGRPPFRAATVGETLLQVLTQEPVPVRQLTPSVPIDLETIAHKCLQKTPARRYATAQELADDLGRYLKGEPIRARPVGAIERAAKWVRRNAVVSALAAAVVLVLTAGVVVSGWFAYAASEEARAARKAEADATDREQAEAAAKRVAQAERRRAEWLVYAGKLALARSADAEGDTLQALAYLNECRWDLRGWEHHHLWTRFDARQTLLGHTQLVTAVAWSPDGTRVVTVAGNYREPFLPGEATVWDAATGRKLLDLAGHFHKISSVAWSRDGTRLVTGSWDRTAKVWDARTGLHALTLKGHAGSVVRVAWSPDGQRVVTGSADRTARVWDTAKRQDVRHLKGHPGRVRAVAFSSDGARIFAWDDRDRVLAWSGTTGQAVEPAEPPARPGPGPARSLDGFLTARPDGKAVAVTDARIQPNSPAWPPPGAAERTRHHSDQAALAEKAKHWFAVAFHVGRLLLDDPDNADLKRRRDEALRKHHGN